MKDSKEYLAEINYTHPQTGKRIRERQTSHRLDLAQQWRQTRKADALRGEIVRKKEQPKPLLFEKFTKEYLESWSKVKKRPSTYIRDQTSTKWLKEMFGKKLLTEITRRDVERYLAKRQEQGKRPATLNRELSCLKNMLRKAVDWNYLEVNPAAEVKQQKEETPEFEFLRDDEITRLLDTCEEHLETLLTLAIYTGMRKGELSKLEWGDVDFNRGENGMITVRGRRYWRVPIFVLVLEAWEAFFLAQGAAGRMDLTG